MKQSQIVVNWFPLIHSKRHNKSKNLIQNTIQLLVFSVTPFKIDQNKNQNRSIDKVQNLGNERRYIYKDPRQDSGQRNISCTRSLASEEMFYANLQRFVWRRHAGTHLDERQHGGRKPTETLLQKREFIPRETHKH